MKKVLFVIESLSGGGAEKVLATLVRHIDRERFHVTVCRQQLSNYLSAHNYGNESEVHKHYQLLENKHYL